MTLRGLIFDLDNTLVDSRLDFEAMRREMELPAGMAILEAIERLPEPEAARCREILHRHELAGAERATLLPGVSELLAEVRGRDMLTGLPKTVVISSEETRRALDEPVRQISDAIKSTLDKTPPELAADIMDRGIVLAGGGALLTGLADRLREETQMPVQLAESPLTCVAVGSGRSLEEFEVIHRSAKARNRNGRRR